MLAGRRRFLRGSFGLALASLFGCAGGREDPALEGGEYLGELPFVGEGDVPLETLLGEGLDGRLYADISALAPGELVMPSPRFYVRTRYPDLLAPEEPWRIAVGGLIEGGDATLALAEIEAAARPMGAILLECSGNTRKGRFGLMSAAEWDGLPLRDLLDRPGLRPGAGARAAWVSGFDAHSKDSAGGHSVPGASWIFRLEELEETGAFLATRMNGEPLPPDHGRPLRLVVPGWYGCTCIKWVNELRLVGENEPATPHMREFASRTHQEGVPELARDFAPAAIDPSAMPVRAERWRIAGRQVLRVIGIAWGRSPPLDALEIRLGDGPFEPVDRIEVASPEGTWSLWSHVFEAVLPGRQAMRLRFDAPGVRTRRLDSGHYQREVEIDALDAPDA